MKTLIFGLLGYLAGLALGAGVFWLGGFNFDHRSPDVAFGAVMVAMLSAIPAVLAGGIAETFNKD